MSTTDRIIEERRDALKRCPIGEPVVRIPVDEVKIDDKGNCYITMLALIIAFAR